MDLVPLYSIFFFNDTATTEIYTLSLHDALPIWLSLASRCNSRCSSSATYDCEVAVRERGKFLDRKSTRLNSSHQIISYAVFCLKKKKQKKFAALDVCIMNNQPFAI